MVRLDVASSNSEENNNNQITNASDIINEQVIASTTTTTTANPTTVTTLIINNQNNLTNVSMTTPEIQQLSTTATVASVNGNNNNNDDNNNTDSNTNNPTDAVEQQSMSPIDETSSLSSTAESTTPSPPPPQQAAQIVLPAVQNVTILPLPPKQHHHQPKQNSMAQQQQTNVVAQQHMPIPLSVATSTPTVVPPPPCAVHHPQQHHMHQAHLAAVAHHHHQQQHHPQQQYSHHPQQHHHPHHMVQTQHHQHMPPPQQQYTHHHQGHLENGHAQQSGGAVNGVLNASNGSTGSVNSSGAGSPSNGPAGQQPPPPPSGIYIPYTGEFYPTDHGYFIQHHHEMCPAHHPGAMMPTEYGPTTVQMVSQNRPPPIPVPVQVPQGQVMQQYVNENGTLTHVVLSPTQYQQLHAGQGGVPHIHAPFITANGTTQHFYGPLPTGFPSGGGPPPHYHPMAPTANSSTGHLQPQQQQQIPHSPSPPSNYHKDERTQRQHTKLLRKLDQKRSEMNTSMVTPNHSPRKSTDLNGLRRTTRNGASSVGTSEDGEESSSVPDEEDDCQTIIDLLSAVPKPEVTDITARSAMLRWEAPPISPEVCINKRDLRYDVLLSDRGKEGKYKLIFKGESYVCLIQDLRPGQEYFVCLQVHYEKLQGCPSEPTVFITPPCEPDQPMPPKLIARTKNSLQLRWQAPIENGSHILQYILEFDEGKGKGFVEITKTKGKQYTLSKLQSSTLYSFRLTAVNECGPSVFSDIIAYSTSGNPPSMPKPPQLQASTANTLRLAWDRRPQDEEYILQMSDRESGHGFLNKYAGPDTIYECKMLQRSTIYHFRLKVENEAGVSPWSNEVSYRTQPERPGRPSKPQVKGKIHGNYFKAKWDPPNDRGGAEIRRYFLEISSGAKFERIYSGPEAETVCDRLSPGTTYQIRVSCEGPGGLSGYSDLSTVTTEAIQPGAPDPPYYENSPGPYAAVIRWYSPDYNGGAPILEYEVKLNGIPDFVDEIVYRGKDMYCVCKNLHPGEPYEASVRAVNRIGAGQWSEPLKFNAGAAPPQTPAEPEIVIRSPTHLLVSWKQPQSNGSPIHEYRLESSTSIESLNNFVMCYQGPQTQADLRNLIPHTLYYFRINASNMAGHSQFSKIVEQKTPAACPGQPQFTTSECTATEITLQWTEPEANGSPISNYQIEYSSGSPPERFSVSTNEPCTEYTITNLAPETSYKFKIQAVNEIGFGQPSNSLKLVTLPPPPEPPNLECTGIGHNFLKLKWGEGRNLDFTEYYLEMYNNRIKDFQLVHSGTSLMHKINKLQEQTEYIFRICAATDRAGTGEYSPEYIFKTGASLPSNIKAPRIVESVVTETNLISTTAGTAFPLTIEWQHSKNTFNDPIEYILQCSNNGKESDYTEVYRGPETKFTFDNVEPGCIYLFRVLPVRCTQIYGDLSGQFSPSLRYQVPHIKLQHHQVILNRDEQHLHNRLNNISNGGLLLTSALTSSSIPLTSSTISSLSQNLTNDYDAVDDPTTISTLQNINSNGINGALKRFQTKCYQYYNRRKRLTDNQKAALLVFSFILLTCIFASIVSLFMG